MKRPAGFWIDPPVALGWRGWSLLIPSVISAVGLASFAVLSLSFTELAVLPDGFRVALVLTGAFSLAAGGEVGTLFSVIEIYRKPVRSVWDWLALAVSGAATLGAFLLAFAALLGVRAGWSPWVQEWGPVIQGLLIAMDAYGLFVEFGLYFSSYDARMHTWRARAEEFERNRRAIEWQQAQQEAQVKRNPPAEIATETQHAQQATAKPQPESQLSAIEAAIRNTSDVEAVADRRVELWQLRKSQPSATQAQLARAVGVSASTVRNDIAAIDAALV